MPQVVSAGLLMYRMAEQPRGAARLEVLLGHPGGPYFARRHEGIWSIPKGMAEPGELDQTPRAWGGPPKLQAAAAGADLLAVARREFGEETGFDPDAVATSAAAGAALAATGGEDFTETAASGRARFLPLGGVKYRGHKIVYVWAFEGDCDPAQMASNTFALEWPRGSGRSMEVPELDRVAWFDLPAARVAIVPAQVRFLDDLEALVAAGGPPPGG
jgi:predicted NUDIX family NTP pyrophosphohydrolase